MYKLVNSTLVVQTLGLWRNRYVYIVALPCIMFYLLFLYCMWLVPCKILLVLDFPLHVAWTFQNPTICVSMLQVACILWNSAFSVFTLHAALSFPYLDLIVYTLHVACTLQSPLLLVFTLYVAQNLGNSISSNSYCMLVTCCWYLFLLFIHCMWLRPCRIRHLLFRYHLI